MGSPNKRCLSFQEDLVASQNGRLDGAAGERLRGHLVACAACRAEQERLARVWAWMGDLPEVPPSPEFRARFWAAAREAERSPRGWDWLGVAGWRPVLAGLAAVWLLGVTGGTLAYRYHAGHASPAGIDTLRVFSGPYPPNSIEQVFFEGPSSGRSGRHS